MVQKLPLVGFDPCRRAAPSLVGRVVLVALVSASPDCVGVLVGRHAGIKAGTGNNPKGCSQTAKLGNITGTRLCYKLHQ